MTSSDGVNVSNFWIFSHKGNYAIGLIVSGLLFINSDSFANS